MNREWENKLLEAMKIYNLDALLLAPSDDMQLLFGLKPFLCARFQGLFIGRSGAFFYVCNVLSRDEIREALGSEVKIYSWWDHEGFIGVMRQALEENGLLGGRIGVNGAVRAFNTQTIAEAMDIRFTDGRQALEYIRIIKTTLQMQELRAAATIADQAYERILGELRPAVTEGEICQKLVGYMSELGGTDCGALVCAGENSAYPHYFGNAGIVRRGAPLLLDFGCQYRSMRSDTSRTVFIGEASDRQREIYGIVLRAQLAAEATCKVGAYIPDIDKTARDIITHAGYGDCFLTRTGHGIGIAVHEGPYITQTNCNYLETGMAFSIEPGIYIAGEMGVRIEDIVLMGPDGSEILNKTSKELAIIPC